MDFSEINQEALRGLYVLGNHMKKSKLDHVFQEMIEIRVSQINGCAYCLDMHWKIARSLGETEQRLYGLSAWRESPYYTEKERAAFALAEGVAKSHVMDDDYFNAAKYFSGEEMTDIVMLVNLIGAWNRLNITFANKETGRYEVKEE